MKEMTLNPCAFCGGKACVCEGEFDGEKVYSVSCENCGVSTGCFEDKQRVINDWNRRSDNLLPCPYCDGKALICESKINGKTYLMVACEDCGVSTFGSEDESEVIAAWNKRTPT